MKIVKGFRIYRLDENQGKSVDDKFKYTECADLKELNNELRKMGYELKIRGLFKPYKFRDLCFDRTYSFPTLFEIVADEFYVSYAHIVLDATDEEKERLSGDHVILKESDFLTEFTAALIYHDVHWIWYKEYNEGFYRGQRFELDRELGSYVIKNIMNPKFEIKSDLWGIKTLSYIK